MRCPLLPAAPLLAVKNAVFLPKTASPETGQRLLLLPGRSETLSLSSILRLGFSGLFLALGSFPSSVSTTSLHLFSAPSLLRCPRASSPRPHRPAMGRRGGLLPLLNLHLPSSPSSPAPPFSKSRLLGPGVRCRTVCPAAPTRPPRQRE